MSSNRAVTVTIAILAGILGLEIGYYGSRSEGIFTQQDVTHEMAQLTLDSVTVPIAGSPARGGVNAETTVVVFTDFSVRGMRDVYENFLNRAFKIHGDKLAVVYKAYPMLQNENSLFKAKAAAAAQKQGKFWEMADVLLDMEGDRLTREHAMQLAVNAGLDQKAFLRDMESPETAELINRDIDLGRRLGIKGVPAMFINGREVVFRAGVNGDELLSAINAEQNRIARIKSLSASNYYVGSLVNYHLDEMTDRTDDMGRPMRGARNALVTIVEYCDYQCPFCRRVESTVDRIVREYPDSVRVVFSHNPLAMHKEAQFAHQAAYAAGLQGKFWEMHDILFENQKRLGLPFLKKYASDIGLDMARFESDMNSAEAKMAVNRSIKEGQKHGISGTPNFLINGKVVEGAISYTNFKKEIDQALKKAMLVQRRTGYTGDRLYKEIMKSGASAAKHKKPAPSQDAKVFVDVSGAPSIGNPDAPVTIVEFTDFQCPFCSRGSDTIDQLMQQNPGKIRLVFKHNPLSFHKNADGAHRAAEAAAMQGKFWEMYKLLFANQRNLALSDIDGYASRIGLDMTKFHADMESEAVRQRVAGDLEQGRKIGVRGTPHFFINGTRMSGAQPLEKFQSAVDIAYKHAAKLMEKGLKGEALYREASKDLQRIAMQRRHLKKAMKMPKVDLPLVQGNSYARGPETAPVTIYQFSEFQCPFCGRVEPTLDEILKTYGGKVRIVFKNFPLSFHKNAQMASEAALAAGAQGKFWEMHKILFDHQRELDRPSLSVYAKEIGLDVAKFDAALDAHTYAQQVTKEMAEGRSQGVTGTPSFIIGGKKISGALPAHEFEKAIDAALGEVKNKP